VRCPLIIGDADDDGQDAATSDACRDDAEGLRTTILLVDIWLLWCVFFFGLVWYLNHYHRQRCETFTYCMPGQVMCPCIKPRSDVDGEDSDSDDGYEKDKLLAKLIPSSSAK
jgi:hypothetical protein